MARQRLGLTHEQLAIKAGCAAATVFLVDARRNATIGSLSIPADALGVGVTDLFPRSRAVSSKPNGTGLARAMADEISRAREALNRIERLAQEGWRGRGLTGPGRQTQRSVPNVRLCRGREIVVLFGG